MKKTKGNSGFTLIEIIVVMAIIGIVMLMATNLIGFSLKSYTIDNTQLEIQQDARHAVQVISNDVRSASSIELTNTPPFTVGNAEKPILVIDGTIGYYKKKTGNTLYRYSNGTENPVIQNLKSISFPDYSNDILVLEIVTQKPGMDNVFDITTKLYSRVD